MSDTYQTTWDNRLVAITGTHELWRRVAEDIQNVLSEVLAGSIYYELPVGLGLLLREITQVWSQNPGKAPDSKIRYYVTQALTLLQKRIDHQRQLDQEQGREDSCASLLSTGIYLTDFCPSEGQPAR